MQDVLVTGLGVVSALGSDISDFRQTLLDGRAGVAPFAHAGLSFSRCRLAGRARNFQPAPGQPRLGAMALHAGRAALDMAGCAPGAVDPSRAGVFVSSSKGGMELFDGEPGRPFRIEDFWSHQPGALLRRELGWNGGGGNYPLACATGGYSIGAAMQAIAEGRLDCALAGSVEASLTPLIWRSFEGLGVLAACGENPAALRGPFDRERRGFVLGEGGGVLFLESGASVARRQAAPLARLAGFACTADAGAWLAPDPSGSQAARCLSLALGSAGLAPGQVDYLNAHGTGTLAGDQAEARAIESAWGPAAGSLAVSSIKAASGHLLGGAGSLEAAATVLALHGGFLPSTYGLREPMPVPFHLVKAGAAPRRGLTAAASLSMGFGGHNVALVFKGVLA